MVTKHLVFRFPEMSFPRNVQRVIRKRMYFVAFTWQNNFNYVYIIKLGQVSYSVSSYLFFQKSSTWRVFFDNRSKLALFSRSLWFFVKLFMTMHWWQRLLTASTAVICAWLGLQAASCFVRLPFKVLVVHNFRTDRPSNKGIVNVFTFVRTLWAAINTSEVALVHGSL